MKYILIGTMLVLMAHAMWAKEWRDIELTFSVDPQKVMTEDQRKDFGIDKMTPKQLEHFKAWLATYATDLCNQFQDKLNKQLDEINSSPQAF